MLNLPCALLLPSFQEFPIISKHAKQCSRSLNPVAQSTNICLLHVFSFELNVKMSLAKRPTAYRRCTVRCLVIYNLLLPNIIQYQQFQQASSQRECKEALKKRQNSLSSVSSVVVLTVQFWFITGAFGCSPVHQAHA